MSKAQAVAELRTMPSRPSGEQVQALAAKYGVTPSSVYGYVREVFGRAAQAPSSGAAPQDTAGEQAPASQPAPASPGESNGANLQPISPILVVKHTPVAAADMPQFSTAPPPSSPTTVSPATGQPETPKAPPAPPQDPKLVAWGVVETMCLVVDRYWVPDQDGDVDAPPGPFTSDEKEKLMEAWAPFVAKYAPLYAQYSVEINVGLVSLAVFGPRWKYAKRVHDQKVLAQKQQRAVQVAERPAQQEVAATPAAAPVDELAIGDAITRRLRNLR